MLQFSGLVALKAIQTGDTVRKSVETTMPNRAVAAKGMPRMCVLCIQTVNKVLISIFLDL
jgi:hypothetical protein